MFLKITAITFTILFSCTSFTLPLTTKKMSISSASPYASQAGLDVSLKGGNIIDATVAVALTLAVTSPYNAGIGGGGFALIKIFNDVEVIDFREKAPELTHPDFFINASQNSNGLVPSRVGGKAVGVPGIIKGLWKLHQRYGRLSWKEVLAEPIQIAEKGFSISGKWRSNTEFSQKNFNKHGKLAVLNSDSKLPDPGDTFKRKNLVRLLKIIQKKGDAGFYKGVVAKDIVNSIKKEGGVLTLQDLKDYKVRWLKPLIYKQKDFTFYLMPPPSSGGIMISNILALMENKKIEKHPPLSTKEQHLMAEIFKHAFRGRSFLGDPDFHKNPIKKLQDKTYINKLSALISSEKTMELPALPLDEFTESNETTHFSIMNEQGQSIAMTLTMNGLYGSGVATKNFQIFLNNQMDDFTTIPDKPNMFGLTQGKGNQVQAGKRPLSSMSPTLIAKNGRLIMSLGAAGGPRIITSVLQTIYRTLFNNFNLDEAIQYPRIHHQYTPNFLTIESQKYPPISVQKLIEKGHKIKTKSIGVVNGVFRNDKGLFQCAFDNRSEGACRGY